MLTYQDQYQMAQQMSGDASAPTLLLFKRDINEGGAVFLNRLGRKFNKEYLTASLKASQQYYEFATEILRISEIRCLNGTNYYTPQYVANELEWNELNTISTSGNFPTHYFIRGFNEVGLYPIPSANVTNGLVVSYEPQHADLSQDDFTTGTITVSNGSQTITHSATGFTPQMVGRWFQVTDGTDPKWYKIGAYTSASALSLENYYEGISGSGRTFRIGEIMKLPNGYHDAPVMFALARYYMTQNDQRTAPTFEVRFEQRLKSARQTYARATSRVGVKTKSGRMTGRGWIDLTKSVIYP